MPINTRELMDAVCTLTDNENMRATIKGSVKGAAMCGASGLVGGLVGGPVGLAIGGIIGAITAAFLARGKFRPVSDIIRNGMSVQEQEKLKDHLLAALAEVHPNDIVLLPLLMSNALARQAVLNTVVSFVTNEMQMQIID